MDAKLDRSSVFGARWQAWKWRLKYALGSRNHVPDFDELVQRPFRPILRDVVLSQRVTSNVLEVGCGKGPNLYLLAKARPDIDLIGVEISRTIIDCTRRELDQRGIGRVTLEVACATDLSAFQDKSVDVVFADAVLIYVAAADIEQALAEMLRVARRAIVISTWHMDEPGCDVVSVYDDGAWIHNYRFLLGRRKNMHLEIVPYPPGAWTDARWMRYGVMVVARHGLQ